jgi:hypothetical protein
MKKTFKKIGYVFFILVISFFISQFSGWNSVNASMVFGQTDSSSEYAFNSSINKEYGIQELGTGLSGIVRSISYKVKVTEHTNNETFNAILYCYDSPAYYTVDGCDMNGNNSGKTYAIFYKNNLSNFSFPSQLNVMEELTDNWSLTGDIILQPDKYYVLSIQGPGNSQPYYLATSSSDVLPGNFKYRSSSGSWVNTDSGTDIYFKLNDTPINPPTCFDGIQNQNETGIDIGGVCQQHYNDIQIPLVFHNSNPTWSFPSDADCISTFSNLGSGFINYGLSNRFITGHASSIAGLSLPDNPSISQADSSISHFCDYIKSSSSYLPNNPSYGGAFYALVDSFIVPNVPEYFMVAYVVYDGFSYNYGNSGNRYYSILYYDGTSFTDLPTTNSEKSITSFSLKSLMPNVDGIIDGANHTISLTVPFGTDVKNLVPTIVVSDKASVIPGDGVSQNFSNPVIYTVKAEDGTTQNYTVTVTPSCTTDCFSNVLFLPGIEASRLYKPDYNGGTTKLWEPNGNDSQVRNLLMDENGVAVRDDIYAKDVIDNGYVPGAKGNIYKSFLDQLDSMKNTEYLINDYSAIPYDWRLSADDLLNNGDKTADGKIYYSGVLGQTTAPYIIKELRRLASESRTRKVTIVAHSTGGLLVKDLTNKLGTEASKLIDKIIFVAVPQVGTPSAIGALLHGFNQAIPLSSLSNIGISDSTVREIGQNMPEPYNLLTSSNYFTSVFDPVITFDNSSILRPWREKYGSSITSGAVLHNFLIDKNRVTLPTQKDIMSPTILNEALLNKAETFHSVVDSWNPPTGVQLIEIAGWGNDTLKTIQYYQGSKADCVFPLFNWHCTNSPILQFNPGTVLDGDKTVLEPSALWTSVSDSVKRYWLDLKSYNNGNLINKKLFPRDHGNILEVSQLRTFIQNIITDKNNSLPEFISTSTPQNPNPATRLHFILHSPLSLDLYDDQGNHTGSSSADNIPEENIPDSSYQTFGEVKFISVPNSNNLHLVMKGSDAGSFTLDVEEVKGDTNINTITFAAVPVLPTTIATLDIPKNTGVNDLSNLSVDEDGNGTADITLIPEIGGVVVPDFVPPEAKISIDPIVKDLKIEGVDDSGIATILKDSNNYIITDKVGNKTKLFFQKTFTGKYLTYAKLIKIQYNNDPIISLPSSSFLYVWNPIANPVTILSQTIAVDSTYAIESIYDKKKNQTTVLLKKKGIAIQKQIFTGFHVSKFTVDKGAIGYEL